ncbi:hypothetical protein Tco_0422411 [Tanacetum coccineum]
MENNVDRSKHDALNKLDGVAEGLLERIRRSRALRASESDVNLKPLKSILKRSIQSPIAKDNNGVRKVSMNPTTMVMESKRSYAFTNFGNAVRVGVSNATGLADSSSKQQGGPNANEPMADANIVGASMDAGVTNSLTNATKQAASPKPLTFFEESWGRSAYARALIEVSAEDAPKEELVIAIPLGKDKGHSLATIRIEYEWTPPRCSTCLIFDHTEEKCPKRPKEVTTTVVTNVEVNHSKDVADDGFEVVKKKRNKKKKHQKQVDGVVLNKPSLTLHYRRVDRENSFSALNDDEDNEWKDNTTWQHSQQVLDVLNESDSEVDEVITLDDRGGNLKTF